MFHRPNILSLLNSISENIQVTEGCILTGPALVGVLYKLQAGKPVILYSVPNRGKGFFFPERPDRFWGPPNLLFSENGGPIPGVKPPLRDADNSHPYNVKIKKELCKILFSILGRWN